MKKIIIYGGVLLALILGIVFLKNENTTYIDEKDYLRKNKEVVNLEDIDDFTGLDILKKELKDKKIIFTGEQNSLNKDDLFKIKLLKYLNKEFDINYYLGEFGSTDAYFLNKYLEIGDESMLRKVFNHNKGADGNNVDDFNFFKQLYEYNLNIPNEKNRIKVIGIGIEHSGISCHDYIYDIIVIRRSIPKKLEILLENLKTKNLEGIKSYSKKVMKDVDKDEDLYKAMFGENFDDFKYLLNNIQAMYISYTSEEKDWNKIRDKYMYYNFKYIDSKLNNAKYFGQWGEEHIYKESINFSGTNIDFIASILNKDEKYKNKVLSIQYGYYNLGKDIRFNNIDSNLFNEFLTTKDDAIVFKLNNINSPFSKKFINPLQDNKNSNKKIVTTDYFDYLVLLKEVEKSK